MATPWPAVTLNPSASHIMRSIAVVIRCHDNDPCRPFYTPALPAYTLVTVEGTLLSAADYNWKVQAPL